MKLGKLKAEFISKDKRFNSSFFLNGDAINSRVIEINKDKCLPLGEMAKVFNPPIFKRQFCQKSERSVQYCRSGDVANTLEGSNIYINRDQAAKVGSIVKKNQILVTGFGTIGNARLVNEMSEGICYANNVCRIESHCDIYYGFLYAFIASKYGKSQLNKYSSGSVVRYIEAPGIKKILIPKFDSSKQSVINDIIIEASKVKVKGLKLIEESKVMLKNTLNLGDLLPCEYEYFGHFESGREISVFKKTIKELTSTTLNAFNYSKKLEIIEQKIKLGTYKLLHECLDENQMFSTGSFRRVEIDSETSIKLLNQSDIFNWRKQGKYLARHYLKTDRMLEYGEVLIAGVGSLGEGETFCNVIFANEELKGQLVSGEFLRMKTNNSIPSGYLYCWLTTDYGFRLIRKTHTGTKLCRPIPKLLENIPVPMVEIEIINQIDEMVKKGHSLLANSIILENQAIDLIEKEIESWQE